MIWPMALVAGACAGALAAFLLARSRRPVPGEPDVVAAGPHPALAAEPQEGKPDFVLQRRAARERELRERGERLQKEEERLHRREEEIQVHAQLLSQREDEYVQAQEESRQVQQGMADLSRELTGLRQQSLDRLLSASGWSRQESVTRYLSKLEEQVQLETELAWEKRLQRIEENSDDEARRLVEIVIQRMRPDYTEDHPQYVASLEDLKGTAAWLKPDSPLFGAFETVTGVKLEWKEMEKVLVLSCPNGLRREIARRTLRKFDQQRDPKIESLERFKKEAERETEAEMRKTIQWVLRKLRIGNLHPEMMKAMGRLQYRTSHAQNVLAHSYEVGFLASMLASELGLDSRTGKRGGFLHDVGKAIEAEQEAGHAVIGGEFAARWGEGEIVVNAIAGHHEDVERKSLFPVLAQVADAMSGGRPGARRETTERFLERVDQLMAIGASLEGVSSYYAVHAGREFRVIVDPGRVKEHQLEELRDRVAAQIEANVPGPGVEIVISRETKVVDYAR